MMSGLKRYMLFCCCFVLFSCSKGDDNIIDPPGGGDTTAVNPFNYTDSVFYLNSGQQDYEVSPVQSRRGTYYGFPEGIDIDKNTGTINVSKSETGLKYLVSFVPDDHSDTLTTFVTISGINYLDGFYKLGTADSILKPVYNGIPEAAIPGLNNGTVFDIGSGCNDQGCNVIPESAVINLAQTVRNGVFGKTPSNNDRHEFELVYRINDKSGKATNKLKVKLYYFETMADVTPEADSIISSRQGTIITKSSSAPSLSVQQRIAKPRPPCIFIVGR
ncbi:MAG: hypothetical protein QM802_13875 [Agriterribacter sp.]